MNYKTIGRKKANKPNRINAMVRFRENQRRKKKPKSHNGSSSQPSCLQHDKRVANFNSEVTGF